MAESVARVGLRPGSREATLAFGAPIAVAVLLLSEALALPAPWLVVEEAATVLEVRGIDALGGREVGPFYPLLLRPLDGMLSTTAFYEAARVLGVLLWAAAFVPALAIARRAVEGVPAVVAAALSVVVPGALYATAVVPDAPAFLLAVSSFALALRFMETRGNAALAGALGLALAAALVRPWLAAVLLSVAVLAAVARLPWRAVTRWPYSASFAVAAGSLYALYFALGAPSLAAALGAGVAGIAAAAVGFGILPWLAAWATVGRVSARPLDALLMLSAPLLALSAGLAAVVNGRSVEERPLLVLSPLVFALAARAWRERQLPATRVALVAGTTAVALVAVPAFGDPALEGLPSLSAGTRLLGSTEGALVVFFVLVFAAAALLVRAGSRLVLVGAAGAIVLAGHVGAWQDARDAADAAATGLPGGRAWVDRAAPDGARVTLVSTVPANEAISAQELLWNRSIRASVTLDPANADPATGALRASPTTYAVVPPGLELAGEPIAAGPAGQLVRVGGVLGLAQLVEGLYPDGWSTGDAFYRRFGAGPAQGTVEVTVSRKVWTGPDKPAQVLIVARPIGGDPFAERVTEIHSAQERTIAIPVPSPPFEIRVLVDPTFSPSEYGQPDTRQLGAQIRFEYRPA